jgi:hypothetical protein
MSFRASLAAAVFVALVAGAPATAQTACAAKTARTVEVAKVARDPAAFVGKCVRLKGYWRDFAVYPTAAEAGQPDALSIATLDQRRVGLYLGPDDLKRAPGGPTASSIVGVAGDCARLEPTAAAAGTAYCKYKQGAFLDVVGIEAAN